MSRWSGTLEPLRWWQIAECARLERALFPDTPWSESTLWSELARVPESRFYVAALSDGDVVGYAGLAALPPDADVQTIAVAPTVRGTGLGSALLDALMSEAARRECRTVMLEVAADNEPALGLYHSRGFEKLSMRRDYYGSGLDALVMRARVS